VAPPRRCNRAGDHALAFFEAGYARTQLLDDADRLVPNRQRLGYRIFALENVNVGAADGRGGDSDQCILRADIGDRFVIEDDPPLLNENGGFHHFAHISSPYCC
jgi:hypothetical protein